MTVPFIFVDVSYYEETVHLHVVVVDFSHTRTVLCHIW